MLFHLFYGALSDKIGFLRVFRYPSTRILASAITALLLSFFLGPWFIEKLKSRQIGEIIRTDGPQTHKKKAGTPTMGGSLLLFCLAIATLLWCDLRSQLVWLALSVTVSLAPGRAQLASGRAVMITSAAVLIAPLTVGSLADATSITAALAVVPVMLVLAAVGLTAVNYSTRSNPPESTKSSRPVRQPPARSASP